MLSNLKNTVIVLTEKNLHIAHTSICQNNLAIAPMYRSLWRFDMNCRRRNISNLWYGRVLGCFFEVCESTVIVRLHVRPIARLWRPSWFYVIIPYIDFWGIRVYWWAPFLRTTKNDTVSSSWFFYLNKSTLLFRFALEPRDVHNILLIS